jgi:hypothetical protein
MVFSGAPSLTVDVGALVLTSAIRGAAYSNCRADGAQHYFLHDLLLNHCER